MPKPLIPLPPSAAQIPSMDLSYQGAPFVDLGLQDDTLLGDLDWYYQAAPYVPPQKPLPSGGTMVGGLGRVKAPSPPFYPISDEGGEVVIYRPNFDLSSGAPFFVQLIDSSYDVWPPETLGCWGVRPGRGAEIYPSRDFGAIRFVLPPLPLGTYALRITDGEGVVRETVNGAFEVLRRARPWPVGYSTINLFPESWPLGPRVPQMEPMAEVANRPPYNGWQALGKAIGWVFQHYASAPCTRLREDLAPEDNSASVETTFLFEPVWGSAEYVWIDGLKVRIFGADRALRTLALSSANPALNRERTAREHTIPAGTPISLDTVGMPHPGAFREPDLGNTPALADVVYEYTNAALFALAIAGSGSPYINPFSALVFWSKIDSAGFGGYIVRGGGVAVMAAAAPSGGYKILFGSGANPSISTFIFGQRYCIAVTTDGSNHRLYVNGVQEAIYAGAAPFGSAGVTFLGFPDSNDGGTFYPRRYAANISFLLAAPSAAALLDIYAAGPTFDVSGGYGVWPGVTPITNYIAAPVGGVVSSRGTDNIGLTLNVNCTWEVLSV